MGRKRTIVVGMLLALSLVLSGCKKKKPPVPAPQAQAPTITDTNVPSEIPEVPVPQPTPEPVPTKPTTTVGKKPKPRTRIETRKTTPAPPAPAASDKVVVDEGSKQPDSAQPPLIASDANSQAAQQRAKANQLLSAAEYNISNLHRTLSGDDQAIVQHIRGYIDQSRQAIKDGDTERAYTLAVKAHLMSDELVKK
jgi:outer membrane biosynthesis protein TonB